MAEPTDIILIHKGCPEYLYYGLLQVVEFNSNSRIHLIGDLTNRHFGRLVQHHMMADYWEGAAAFERVYEHHSDNPAAFECFCYQRWFVLDELVRRLGIERFVYLDTDTMLYCDLAGEFSKFSGYEVALAYDQIDPEYVKASGCLSFWMSPHGLAEFCSYLTELYQGRNASLALMVDQYLQRKSANRPAAVNDMSAFGFFLNSETTKVTSSTQVTGGSVHTRAFEDGRFECANGETVFEWTDGVPFARRHTDGGLIRVCSHQCNGPAGKASMRKLRSNCRRDGDGLDSAIGRRLKLSRLQVHLIAARMRSVSARAYAKTRQKVLRLAGSGR